MRVVERSFSDLISRSDDVVDGLADHDVVLRLRNSPLMRLSATGRDADCLNAFELLAQLLHNEMSNEVGQLERMVGDVFPWAKFLPLTDRRSFVDELTSILVGILDLDDYAPIGRLLRQWRATAEIHADPVLFRRLSSPIDSDEAST